MLSNTSFTIEEQMKNKEKTYLRICFFSLLYSVACARIITKEGAYE